MGRTGQKERGAGHGRKTEPYAPAQRHVALGKPRGSSSCSPGTGKRCPGQGPRGRIIVTRPSSPKLAITSAAPSFNASQRFLCPLRLLPHQTNQGSQRQLDVQQGKHQTTNTLLQPSSSMAPAFSSNVCHGGPACLILEPKVLQPAHSIARPRLWGQKHRIQGRRPSCLSVFSLVGSPKHTN